MCVSSSTRSTSLNSNGATWMGLTWFHVGLPTAWPDLHSLPPEGSRISSCRLSGELYHHCALKQTHESSWGLLSHQTTPSANCPLLFILHSSLMLGHSKKVAHVTHIADWRSNSRNSRANYWVISYSERTEQDPCSANSSVLWVVFLQRFSTVAD